MRSTTSLHTGPIAQKRLRNDETRITEARVAKSAMWLSGWLLGLFA